MKAKVIVRLKEGVLDPQGETIRRSLNKMGHAGVARVRQGKYFEVEFNGLEEEAALRKIVETISKDVLSNPIIESFEIEEIS